MEELFLVAVLPGHQGWIKKGFLEEVTPELCQLCLSWPLPTS